VEQPRKSRVPPRSIDFTLNQIGKNKRRAAKILGIAERTLRSRVTA
jgi:DNA-binding protein Fis